MSTHDETAPGLTDTDINSERPDGSGGEGTHATSATSATTSGTSDGSPADASGAATHEDVERGNADGSTASAEPREDALGDAQDAAGSEAQAWADQASAEGESGQDNGRGE